MNRSENLVQKAYFINCCSIGYWDRMVVVLIVSVCSIRIIRQGLVYDISELDFIPLSGPVVGIDLRSLPLACVCFFCSTYHLRMVRLKSIVFKFEHHCMLS